MRKTLLIFICFQFLLVSCSDKPEKQTNGEIGDKCSTNEDCPQNHICDLTTERCVPEEMPDGPKLPGDNGNGESDDSDTSNGENGNDVDEKPDEPVQPGHDCIPGEEEECPYQGPEGTEGVGECRAAVRTCKEDGTWGFCEGEVLPVPEIGELCNTGRDDDCSGHVDTGIDYDGDGVPVCLDCCEFPEDCPDPAKAWDHERHFCSWNEEDHDHLYQCDENLVEGNKDPFNYAKAMGLCHKVTEDSEEWGVISAEIMLPDESGNPHPESHNILSGLGDNIKPLLGSKMLALSSGEAINPFPDDHRDWGIKTNAPPDWLDFHGGDLPSAPDCPPGDSINDAVMLKLRIRVPGGVRSFSFNIYFLSMEFPNWVCNAYNDFFIALLDSEHESDNPDFQNPADKNLAVEASGYPVGVNMAHLTEAELFTVCEVSPDWPSCQGVSDLINTGGFETGLADSIPANMTPRGGTGWLTVRGNVVPGEVITLRLAIWDTGDHRFDSMVLIDNFRWQFEEYVPGTGPS